jgi:hypothetical protein
MQSVAQAKRQLRTLRLSSRKGQLLHGPQGRHQRIIFFIVLGNKHDVYMRHPHFSFYIRHASLRWRVLPQHTQSRPQYQGAHTIRRHSLPTLVPPRPSL